VSTPHREVSGSDAYAAFEFQLMFGVELLLEKFDQVEDYAVLFEFHDDIVLITGASTPSQIEFFQLKHSTTGNWTMRKLCHQKKLKKATHKAHSIFQKLYENVVRFEDYATNAQIVSNTFCAEFGQSENSKFNTISSEKQAKLLTHLTEVNPNAKNDCLNILGFRRTELNKAACYDLVKGRVHTFLQNKIGGDAFQLQACTDAIVTQCRIRNNKLATNVPENFPAIVNQKGITRNDLEQWLSEISASKTAADWSVIQPSLGADWPFIEMNAVRLAYESFKVVALDSSNDAQNAMVRMVRLKLDATDKFLSQTLSQSITGLLSDKELANEAIQNGFSAIQLKAVILYEIFKSDEAGTIQKIDTQSSEEDK